MTAERAEGKERKECGGTRFLQKAGFPRSPYALTLNAKFRFHPPPSPSSAAGGGGLCFWGPVL